MPVTAAPRDLPPSLIDLVPEALRSLDDPQKDIPRVAKDPAIMEQVEQALLQVPTTHHFFRQDAREVALEPGSVHLARIFHG
jgi:hypothetical protein